MKFWRRAEKTLLIVKSEVPQRPLPEKQSRRAEPNLTIICICIFVVGCVCVCVRIERGEDPTCTSALLTIVFFCVYCFIFLFFLWRGSNQASGYILL